MLDRKEIKKIIDDYKGDTIKEITKKNYISKIYNFHIKNTKINLESETDLIAYFKSNFDNYKTTSLMGIISSIIIYLQAKDKDFKLLLDYLFQIQVAYRKQLNKKNEKEKENWINYEELKEFAQQKYKQLRLYKHDKEFYLEKLQQVILIFLYVYLPPRRNDYRNCYILTHYKYKKLKNKNENYLVYDFPKQTLFFSFNNYKTFSKYGEQIIQIQHRRLRILLSNYIKMIYKQEQPLLLFHNYSNKIEPMSSPDFSKYMSLAFIDTGKHITSSLLRKIFISNEVSIQNVKQNLEKAKATAYKMGHSLSTQQNVYYKDK